MLLVEMGSYAWDNTLYEDRGHFIDQQMSEK